MGKYKRWNHTTQEKGVATHVKIMQGIEKGIKAFNVTVKKLDTKLTQKKLGEWL